ncbi:transcriptional regulator [Cognatishimia sp. F0-27]|uniref:transcriptional regulator n=1 Tax=Cognatishimia sp. F0-27 TaxID=2816855 RepID=UPI001D0C308A|nr:transcriptional regulator [Cognatishimia sp. F0-27]MCC1493813.1 transcriptional regulator [Cognatishimia sp. F0-27]
MKDVAERISISVLGSLSVQSEAGTNLTPKGVKNQALLALLALSPGMTRPRRWVEDKLWSGFAPEQSSANLRQALTKVRAALGAWRDVLNADRTDLWLDAARLQVDVLEAPSLAAIKGTEILQGLDARDPEFEDWLRQERATWAARIEADTPRVSRGVLIACRTVSEDSARQQMMGDVLANQIGETVSEQVRAWRQSDGSDDETDLPRSDVTITSQIVADGADHALFLKAVHQATGRILYSKTQTIASLGEILNADERIAKTAFEAADQIVGKLPQILDGNRPEARATALSRQGLFRMFSFEQEALHEASDLMARAFEQDRNGLYLAWSSLIRLTQLMEMPEGDQRGLSEEAIALHHKAMELDADNGLIHAIVSKVRGTALGDPAGVLDYARVAVERNPVSAFAWKALAEGYMLAGRTEEAFVASARACKIARSSPFRHWWETGHCVISIAAGRPFDAIEAGEAAVRSAPFSRPAYRHLLALYAMDGQLEKARSVADRLAQIEPGFSLDRLVHDETYPVRTLRNTGLLEPIKLLI